MVRQAHHPEQGRRAISNDQNHKFQTTDAPQIILFIWFRSLKFRIWNLFDPILRSGGACILVF